MIQRVVARRYASALFDVVEKSGDLDRAQTDLSRVAETLAGHAELVLVLESPAVPTPKKRALVEAILDAGGGITIEVRRLLLMLADKDRLNVLSEISAAFAERVMRASRVLPADVVTATPLEPEGRAALAAALGRATGGEVTINERVDPTITGGVIARVGGVVFDGSVTRQIERLRQKLLAGA